MSLLKLIKKDLKIVLSDKKAFILLVGMPIILFSILSFALAGSFDDGESSLWTIEVGVVKQYSFEEDYEAIKAYASKDDLREVEDILFSVLDDEALSFITYDILDYDTAVEKIENNELASVIVLPENYLANLMINMSPTFRKPIEIEIIRNIDRSYSSDIVENIVNEVTSQISQIMITNKVAHETLSYHDVPSEIIDAILVVLQEQGQTQEQIKMQVNDYKIDTLKTVNSAQYYSVAMMAMFLLFGASYGAKFMLEEKKKFTLQRQMMAGIMPTKIIIGKVSLIFCIAILQISMMILTSTIGFQVYWGNPVHVILLTLLVAFAVMGFGSILAALALKMDSLKALNIFESGIFQVIALFGGSYFPLFLMPVWFRIVSKTLLNGAALDAYHKLMMGASFEQILPALLSLALNGIVFLVIGLSIIQTHSSRTLEIESEETA